MKKDSKLYLERIDKLQAALKTEGSPACFVDDFYDLFYLTGLKLSLGHLFVFQTKAALFVDGRYFEIASKYSPVPVHKLTAENEKNYLKGVGKLWANGDTLSHSQFVNLRKLGTKPHSDPSLYKKMRLIKGSEEIKKMKVSAQFAYEAYQRIRKKLKTGITEIEIARELEIDCLKRGAEKMSFEPIIAFGKNSAFPHHHPGETKLKKDDIVLFDLGVVLDGYCSDMTRVDFVGKIDPILKKLYDVNLDAQRAALALCKPGFTLKELDLAARKVMARAKLEDYFIHGLGHGIGLEVHEFPRINKDGVDKNVKLEAGMAITIEPGLYLPGKGGVRYEDTVIITPKGVMNLY